MVADAGDYVAGKEDIVTVILLADRVMRASVLYPCSQEKATYNYDLSQVPSPGFPTP